METANSAGGGGLPPDQTRKSAAEPSERLRGGRAGETRSGETRRQKPRLQGSGRSRGARRAQSSVQEGWPWTEPWESGLWSCHWSQQKKTGSPPSSRARGSQQPQTPVGEASM